ncbi:PPE family protein [Mycobacterium sp. pUA109]|uniref:PPE family protein n=1 Tax=Mycobacterium sp. pUA109 TaxID=3238982 RepID=UPI00351AB26C
MDFAALPPEINSGRMYAGPGSASLRAAAEAWQGLAAELRASAVSYSSAISGLTAAWTGPSSASMAAAAAPYVAWLTTTATQAEQTANQARAAAAAYETAFAATVPPPVIAANRAQLASLVAGNIMGQNTAAIAATEAQYASMWAQDSAAMYSYAGQSAAAATVTPFSAPAPNTNPAGGASQGAAVAQAVGSSAASNTQSVLSQVTSTTPGALQSLAAPAAAADPVSSLTNLLSSINSSPLASLAADVELLPKAILPANDILISIIMGLVIGGRHLSDVAVGVAGAGAGSAAGPALPAAGLPAAASAAVSASVGESGFVGALSTPPSWATATPAIRTVAAVLSSAGEGAVPAAAVSQMSLFSETGMAGMAAGALGTAIPRTLTGGGSKLRAAATKDVKDLKDKESSPNLQRVVAEMAEKPESVQHWRTDSEHLDALLAELQQKPGIHAVHVSNSDKPRMTPPRSQLF